MFDGVLSAVVCVLAVCVYGGLWGAVVVVLAAAEAFSSIAGPNCFSRWGGG